MKEQQGFSQEDHAPTGKMEVRTFGNYDLVRRIDVGGMGEVYLARQRTAFGREVAVKIIRPDLAYDMTARKRFQREAEVSAYLKHDHILPLLEFNEEQGRLFLVTPYIKGGNLSRRLQSGPLPLNEIYQLFTALVEAVAYLHRRGVIHRDLKPGNILLDHAEDSDRVYVRLIDFGIASLLGTQASAPLTMAGHEMGTVAYMAPERLDGIAAASNDIYSLGIILFQMITGKLPEDAPDATFPEPLAYVVRHCTATDPANRFASATDLLQVFEQAYQAVRQSSPAHEAIMPLPTIPETGPAVAAVVEQKLPPEQDDEGDQTILRSPPLSRTGPQPAMSRQGTGPQPVISRQRTGPHPVVSRQHTGPQPVMARQNTGPQPALYHSNSGSTPNANSLSARAEIVLPPLPGKEESFSGVDYDAPTSYIDPNIVKKSRRSRAQAQNTGSHSVLPPSPRKRKAGIPVWLVITGIMVIVGALIVAIGFSVYQASTNARVSLMPRTQMVSAVFTITAKVNAQTDLATATIPANVISSTKTSTLEGNTTGSAGCVLGIFDCKQAVAASDVFRISDQIRPTLKTQIEQELRQKAHADGMQTVGNIVYNNESFSPDPQVGQLSKTVKVTMSLTGSQEYIKPKDAQTLAQQMLVKKLKKDYEMISSLLQIGTPVVQSIGPDGTVKLAVAAGGVGRYHIPDSELTRLKNKLKGLSKTQAQTLLAKEADLDPAGLSVTISQGDTIPSDTGKITITTLNPSNLPRVQLTPVAPPKQ